MLAVVRMTSLWRRYVPKRFSEIVTLVSLSTTLFLFIQTRELTHRLNEIRRPYDDISSGVSSGGSSGGDPTSSSQNRLQTGNEVGGGGSSKHISQTHSQKSRPPYSWELQEKPLDIQELNNTLKSGKELLFFNRVPKVGSQTAMELLRLLSIRNNFNFHKDRTQKVENIKLTVNEEKWLVNMVDYFTPPSAYVKHVCFVDFSRHNTSVPIYVNLVRDPVERVISWYYYVRAPWYFVERKRAFPELPLPNPNWLRKDFEKCVRLNDPECRYYPGLKHDGFGDHRRQTMFFCGQDDDCTGFNTEVAMKKAMYNVEKNYAVVGVLEDMNKTLTVLEHYVPRFFKGALKTYWEDMKNFRSLNRNIYKPPVSEETKDLVRKNFTREIEFFEFCKQRLHRQYMALNLN